MTHGRRGQFHRPLRDGRSAAPVRTGTEVTSLRAADDGYLVRTDAGEFRCRSVVIASGACNRPSVPALSGTRLPAAITQLTPSDYRNPDQLPDGGVLVVGASATGVQLAAELQRSGRPVTLSVGEHVRMPRTYRGRDVMWWMDAAGVWEQRYDEVDDLNRARRLPSPQLVGTPERATLDLNALEATRRRGGRALGLGARRPGAVLGRVAQRLRPRRPQARAAARHVRRMGPRQRPRRPRSGRPNVSRRPGCRTRRDCSSTSTVARSAPSSGRPAIGPTTAGSTCPWSTKRATCATRAACSPCPGLYALGLPVLRRRKSTFIHGIEDDARDVIDHLAGYLGGRAS